MKIMQDIVILSYSRTDSAYSSTAFSLAKALAKKHRVFYIEQPLTWKDVIVQWNSSTVQSRRAVLTGKPRFCHRNEWPELLTVITLPPFLPVNFLPEGKLYRQMNRLNERLLWQALGIIMNRYRLQNWLFLNVYYPYVGFQFPADLRPIVKSYYSIDDISQESYTSRHGVVGEKLLAAAYDFILTTGRALYQKMRTLNPHTYLIPNGADVTLFSKAAAQTLPRPHDMPPPDKSCAIYIGNIDAARNDFALLAKLAGTCTDINLVFIGPLSSPKEVEAVGLHRLPNVFFLGSKPMDGLPAYLQHAQCALIPFLCNTLTKSIYPLKINEYLAAGKPVVTTAFSEDIRSFGEVVALAETHEAFIAAIRYSIANDSPEKVSRRMAIAAQNTWEARARQLETIVQEFLQ
jgi:glycosyltransferase involved in cell wall biosynthesis